MLDFGKTTCNDIVLVLTEFLRHIGAPNESLRLIIIYYMFKYTFGTKITLLESLQNQKMPFKGSISAKLLIMTLF